MSASGLTPVQAARAAERRDRWRSPTLYLRLAVVLAWALLPAIGPSFQLLDLALKIALFATLAASYDVVIGYTGIVSFGHAMFFGFGAYAVALAVGRLGAPTYGHLVLGFLAGIAVSGVVAVDEPPRNGIPGTFALEQNAPRLTSHSTRCTAFSPAMAILRMKKMSGYSRMLLIAWLRAAGFCWKR